MPHFIINSESIQDDCVIITDTELYNHIAKALRAKVNEGLLFIDQNEMQYETIIKDINKKTIIAKIINSYKSKRKLDINIFLAQSVLKPDAQYSIIQKSTELGVKGIIPLITDNSTIKESVAKEKIEKWQKIAVESVKQCERADIPQVYPLINFSQMVQNLSEFDYVFTFVEKNSDLTLQQYFAKNKINKKKKILAIIGPEGGFSDSEFEILMEQKISMVTLGDLIYRADTAAVVALASLIYGMQNE